MIKFFATLLSTLALAGCSNGGTNLTIENRSSVRVESIQAQGPGFAAFVGDLDPGKRTSIQIYPRGEAGIGLMFSANNREFKIPVSGYFEPGYDVSVVISEGMSVTVDSDF